MTAVGEYLVIFPNNINFPITCDDIHIEQDWVVLRLGGIALCVISKTSQPIIRKVEKQGGLEHPEDFMRP